METISQKRLKTIEAKFYNVGQKLVDTFEQENDLATIRMAVACSRTSMQAMRDQSRYKVAPVATKGRKTTKKTK